MAKAVLVEDDIAAGRALLNALDASGLDVSSAFWYLESEESDWRLILAMPSVDAEGSKSVYSRIQPIADQAAPTLFFNVTVTSPNDHVVRLLNTAIQTGPGIAGIRFTNNAVSGVLIHDAYIYRLNSPKPPSRRRQRVG